MSFLHPGWLAVAAALAVLGLAGVRAAERRRERDLGRLIAAPLRASLTATSSTRRRLASAGLVVAALVFGCAALARPTLGWTWRETRRHGTSVLFLVDVSRSMLAADVKPDRLARAKLAVLDLLQKLPGDRVGLVAFAGSAFVQAPLTTDHEAFRETLVALDTDVIPRGGTDIGAALHEAEEAFRTAEAGPKLVVLLSDGEDLAGGAKVAAAEAAKHGMTVFSVGIGTAAGDHISLAQAGGHGLVRDARGEPVVSKLDETGLRELAEATGGFYVALGAHGEGIDEIYTRALAEAPRRELAAREERTPSERFQWPLALALALAVGEGLVGERRRAARVGRPLRHAAVTASFALVLAATAASASVREAEKAYAAGAYDDAERRYRSAADAAPDDPRLRFNEGVAAYRAGRHESAAQAFEQAIAEGDVALQQRAYYDLGNARVLMGDAASGSDLAGAKAAFEAAVKAYDGALALDEKDEDARFNREIAKARLDALKRAQEQARGSQEGSGGTQARDRQGDPTQETSGEARGAAQQAQSGSARGTSESTSGAQPEASAGSPSGGSAPGDGQPHPGAQPQPGEHQSPEAAADGPDARGDARGSGAGDGRATDRAASSPPREASMQIGEEPTAKEGQGGSTSPRAHPQPVDGAGSGEPGSRREPAGGHGGDAGERDGEIARADGRSDGSTSRAMQANGRPGEMSTEDAERLLDSLRGDERPSPRIASDDRGTRSSDDESIRNW